MSTTSLIVAAAETGSESGPNHWLVGGLVLVLFLVLMLGLLAFGAGRDHS